MSKWLPSILLFTGGCYPFCTSNLSSFFPSNYIVSASYDNCISLVGFWWKNTGVPQARKKYCQFNTGLTYQVHMMLFFPVNYVPLHHFTDEDSSMFFPDLIWLMSSAIEIEINSSWRRLKCTLRATQPWVISWSTASCTPSKLSYSQLRGRGWRGREFCCLWRAVCWREKRVSRNCQK